MSPGKRRRVVRDKSIDVSEEISAAISTKDSYQFRKLLGIMPHRAVVFTFTAL